MKYLFMFLMLLLLPIHAFAGAFVSGGYMGSNPNDGKNASDMVASVGYFHNVGVVDVGAEVTSNKLYMGLVRKRFGSKWSIEGGVGRMNQDYGIDSASGTVFMVGGTHKIKGKHFIFARYMYSNMDGSDTRSKTVPVGHHGKTRTVTVSENFDLSSNTIWSGYRYSF